VIVQGPHIGRGHLLVLNQRLFQDVHLSERTQTDIITVIMMPQGRSTC